MITASSRPVDSPLKLKTSIPGQNTVEVSFSSVPAGWIETLRRLPDVQAVGSEDHIFRLSTRNGPAHHPGLNGGGGAVPTSRCSPSPSMAPPWTTSSSTTPAAACATSCSGVGRGQPVHAEAQLDGTHLAIIEREMRRFRRSPVLIAMSMVMPIVQLVVLGYAFGGNVKHLKVAIVDQDHGVPAVRVREMASGGGVGARAPSTSFYADPGQALTDLGTVYVNGVLTIPPDFSRLGLARNEAAARPDRGQHGHFVSVAWPAPSGECSRRTRRR